MEIIKTEIEGLLIIKPRIFGDERGYFFESFNSQKFKDLVGFEGEFVQDNESLSEKGVLRGLHFQKPPMAQGKLVRVTQGSVLDVAVDLRENSDTYGRSISIELSGENKLMFWIPPGFAHGFVSLEDNTRFLYKCTNFYSPEHEETLMWNDADLDINWGVADPKISKKDEEGKVFCSFVTPFYI